MEVGIVCWLRSLGAKVCTLKSRGYAEPAHRSLSGPCADCAVRSADFIPLSPQRLFLSSSSASTTMSQFHSGFSSRANPDNPLKIPLRFRTQASKALEVQDLAEVQELRHVYGTATGSAADKFLIACKTHIKSIYSNVDYQANQSLQHQYAQDQICHAERMIVHVSPSQNLSSAVCARILTDYRAGPWGVRIFSSFTLPASVRSDHGGHHSEPWARSYEDPCPLAGTKSHRSSMANFCGG